MVGVGETYLPAFVLALTANQLASGLVATVPMLWGALLQLVTPLAVRRLRSYRRWVLVCAAVQAASFVPLAVAALTGRMSVLLVFTVASVYWAAALGTAPAWNAWVETLVPQGLRARFFARRTRVSQVGLLAGFVLGGLLLQAGTRLGQPLNAFALLFVIAGTARLVSAHYLGRQREPLPPGPPLEPITPGRIVSSVRHDADGRLLLFLLSTQLAVWVAGPYFTAYMFVHLGLSYVSYVALICAAYVAKIVFLPVLGRAAQQWGARRVLWASGLIIAPVPALWLASDHFVYLLVLQVISGGAWAAYELAMLLLFLDTIPRQKRVVILTAYNVANAAAVLCGSLLGGMLLTAFASTRLAYGAVFVASMLARFAALGLLVRMPRVVARRVPVATRAVALQPTVGSIERPVLAGLDSQGDGPAPHAPMVAVEREVAVAESSPLRPSAAKDRNPRLEQSSHVEAQGA